MTNVTGRSTLLRPFPYQKEEPSREGSSLCTGRLAMFPDLVRETGAPDPLYTSPKSAVQTVQGERTPEQVICQPGRKTSNANELFQNDDLEYLACGGRRDGSHFQY